IEPDVPAQRPAHGFSAARDHDRCGELAVHHEQFVSRILLDLAPDPPDFLDRAGDYGWVKVTQEAIDLDIMVVAIRREADQLVRSNQTTKPRPIRAARRHALPFVDDDT